MTPRGDAQIRGGHLSSVRGSLDRAAGRGDSGSEPRLPRGFGWLTLEEHATDIREHYVHRYWLPVTYAIGIVMGFLIGVTWSWR